MALLQGLGAVGDWRPTGEDNRSANDNSHFIGFTGYVRGFSSAKVYAILNGKPKSACFLTQQLVPECSLAQASLEMDPQQSPGVEDMSPENRVSGVEQCCTDNFAPSAYLELLTACDSIFPHSG